MGFNSLWEWQNFMQSTSSIIWTVQFQFPMGMAKLPCAEVKPVVRGEWIVSIPYGNGKTQNMVRIAQHLVSIPYGNGKTYGKKAVFLGDSIWFQFPMGMAKPYIPFNGDLP